jgi:hypothetical protein
MKHSLTFAMSFIGLTVQAFAGTIYLNVTPNASPVPAPIGVQTRYKIDTTNWDMMLGTGEQPITNHTTMTVNMSNSLSFFDNKTFHYKVVNIAGEGVYFQLDDPNTAGVDFQRAWGTFSALPAANNSATSATLRNKANTADVTPASFDYNGLHLLALANASTFTNEVLFSNAVFTAPGQTLVGTLPSSGSAKSTGPNTNEAYLAYFTSGNTPGNLASIDWTFEADVILKASGGNPKEGLKFEFTGKTFDFTPIPEPASILSALTGLGLAGLLARKARGV